MKKNSESLTWDEIVRWALAAGFTYLGLVYVGFFAFWGIILSFVIAFLCYIFNDKISDIFFEECTNVVLINSFCFAMFGIGEIMWGFIIAIIYAILCSLYWMEKAHISPCLAFIDILVLGFGFMLFYETFVLDLHGHKVYETAFEKDAREFSQIKQKASEALRKNAFLSDDNKVQKQRLDETLPLVALKVEQQKSALDSITVARDSTIAHFLKKKNEDFAPLLAQYMNKKEMVRIKRIWLNSEILPWTYDAYTHIFFGVRSHRGFLSSSSSMNLNLSGNASFTGENKLDYVNVIFSNNIYCRYLIKDNPEWLLVKEGDIVEMRYEYNNIGVNTDLCKKFGTSDFNILFKKTFVPLYKK